MSVPVSRDRLWGEVVLLPAGRVTKGCHTNSPAPRLKIWTLNKAASSSPVTRGASPRTCTRQRKTDRSESIFLSGSPPDFTSARDPGGVCPHKYIS